MAHKDDRANDRAKVKIRYSDGTRFLEVEMEGANNALSENVRNMTQTIARGGSPQARSLPAKAPKAAENGGSTPQQQIEMEFDHPDDSSDETGDAAVPEPEVQVRPRKERKGSAYKLLDELDLAGGAVSFRTYCDQKKPANDSHKCLVVASWLKEHLNITAIGGDHLNTCYRWMKWTQQADLTSPLRNLKRQQMFKSGSETGTYVMTPLGQDAVNNMSGAAST